MVCLVNKVSNANVKEDKFQNKKKSSKSVKNELPTNNFDYCLLYRYRNRILYYNSNLFISGLIGDLN